MIKYFHRDFSVTYSLILFIGLLGIREMHLIGIILSLLGVRIEVFTRTSKIPSYCTVSCCQNNKNYLL